VSLFLYLLLGHLLGDFVLQSSELVRLKRVKTYGLYPHVALVTLATALTTLGSTPYAWLALGFVAAGHLLLDRLAIVAFARIEARQIFVFLADQVAHVAVLVVIAWVFTQFSGQPVTNPWLVPLSDWAVAVLCGLLTVAFAGSILVFETTEAVDPSDPESTEGALLGYSMPRIAGMIERGIVYLAAVLGY
jgi:hypothetical protein